MDFGKDNELTDEQYDILKERFGKKEIVEGQIVPCTIKLILNDGIIVALSEQEEGIISEREFIKHPELQVDDTIDVHVGSSIDVNGRRRVSYTKALSRRKWEILKEIKQKGEIIQGYIKSSNKGGFIVDVMDLEAFLPGSQIDFNSIDDFDQFVGTTMDFKIIELNPSLHRFIVSHRAIIEEERRREILSTLKEGSLLEGIVKKIMPYGVLVKAGSILGLIQKTDLSWNYCNDPHDMLSHPNIEVNADDNSCNQGVFWNWRVYFKYNDNSFMWGYDNIIYLLNRINEPKKRDSNHKNERDDKYFCIHMNELPDVSQKGLLIRLTRLAEEASR